MPYKFLSHTADVKIIAEGKNIEESFMNSAYALKEAIAKDKKDEIKSKIKKKIKIDGIDLENLLYNFLEEFLFLFDAEDFLVSSISNIKIDKKKFSLNAEILGDKASKYDISNEVKAITYNNVSVKEEKRAGKKKFICRFVLDV